MEKQHINAPQQSSTWARKLFRRRSSFRRLPWGAGLLSSSPKRRSHSLPPLAASPRQPFLSNVILFAPDQLRAALTSARLRTCRPGGVSQGRLRRCSRQPALFVFPQVTGSLVDQDFWPPGQVPRNQAKNEYANYFGRRRRSFRQPPGGHSPKHSSPKHSPKHSSKHSPHSRAALEASTRTPLLSHVFYGNQKSFTQR